MKVSNSVRPVRFMFRHIRLLSNIPNFLCETKRVARVRLWLNELTCNSFGFAVVVDLFFFTVTFTLLVIMLLHSIQQLYVFLK